MKSEIRHGTNSSEIQGIARPDEDRGIAGTAWAGKIRKSLSPTEIEKVMKGKRETRGGKRVKV